MKDVIDEEDGERLRRVCRAALGDELRSLTYFTPDASEHLYLRDDLDRGDDPLAFVMNEQKGFDENQSYGWSELGDYVCTVRAFTDGTIVRVIEDGRGAYVTTDAMTMERFSEVAKAMHEVLGEIDG